MSKGGRISKNEREPSQWEGWRKTTGGRNWIDGRDESRGLDLSLLQVMNEVHFCECWFVSNCSYCVSHFNCPPRTHTCNYKIPKGNLKKTCSKEFLQLAVHHSRIGSISVIFTDFLTAQSELIWIQHSRASGMNSSGVWLMCRRLSGLISAFAV